MIALFFSLPLYLSLFGENLFIKLLNTLIAPYAIYLLFNKKISFKDGFFIGILWFWWIAFSFKYYNLSYLIPFIILAFGIVYGFIFYFISKLPYSNYLLLFMLAFGFENLSIFSFDWFNPQIIIANSFFAPIKYVFILILLAAFLKDKILSPIFLIIALLIPSPQIQLPNLKIKLISTNIPQEKKWQKDEIKKEIASNIKEIKKAIKEKYDAIVLPESAFPILLNLNENLIKKLKKLSKKIVIITGALQYKEKKFYNSTFIFKNEKLIVINKHILVPFGEYIPFPFFQKEINQIFFNGASDYTAAKDFGVFEIKGYKFLNAICYELTTKELYKKKPKYIIGISNMAWFPEFGAIMQKELIKIYAKEHKKAVFHALNGFKSYIIH